MRPFTAPRPVSVSGAPVGGPRTRWRRTQSREYFSQALAARHQGFLQGIGLVLALRNARVRKRIASLVFRNTGVRCLDMIPRNLCQVEAHGLRLSRTTTQAFPTVSDGEHRRQVATMDFRCRREYRRPRDHRPRLAGAASLPRTQATHAGSACGTGSPRAG